MRIKKLSVLLLAVFLGASSAHAADFGQELFDFFVRKMDPEKAELHLQSLPTEKGEIPWAYLECVNANVRGMNIRSLKMDCFDAVITPPKKWKKMEHPYVESMLACHAEGIFTEKDVNAFLHNRLFGHDKEWERISVRMKDDRIYCNAQLDAAGIRKYCPVDEKASALLKAAYDKLGLSARGYDRVLRVARTIADLAGSEQIEAAHVAEAVQYRSFRIGEQNL